MHSRVTRIYPWVFWAPNVIPSVVLLVWSRIRNHYFWLGICQSNSNGSETFIHLRPSLLPDGEFSSPNRFRGVDWLTMLQYRNTRTSTCHSLPRIYLSVKMESFYFNCLLAELIDYEHAKFSSTCAVDENHLGGS